MSRAPASLKRPQASLLAGFRRSLRSSLRAKRSNPDCFRENSLDCFVARAPRNDEPPNEHPWQCPSSRISPPMTTARRGWPASR
ncbi:hypothetical protein GPL20_17225 [Bradyrhizobium cajani]|uniref:Uncharacterized protein n=1 Tax=Bradyrhizobium cajani TaxID=1928661 RepID=A0A844T932_9BRAD|nr:hypothetical protein [Bradyrhizobium cajani]